MIFPILLISINKPKNNTHKNHKIISKYKKLNRSLDLNFFSSDTNTIFYDNLELGIDNWIIGNGWDLSNIEFSSPTHSFHHSVGKNENDTLLTPNYLLPEINNDYEKLYFSFDILSDMPDSDSDDDGFLEDYYRIWLKDIDSSINGYSNERLDYLETPLISLNGNNYELTFKLLHKLERNNLNLPYNDNGCIVDGWDAANVQISEDNGNNWKVLLGSPEYNCDNCFGFRFNTGECNISGWTDIIDDWKNARFDLSEYDGKTIKIRFAFASDPGFSSVDDQQNIITGFHIDNILISNDSDTLLFDNGDDLISLIPNNKSVWNLNSFNGFNNTKSWWAGKELKSPHYQITYDYGNENRPGSSGSWDVYGPGSPFNDETNMSLDLSDWEGKNIRIGWEFISDDDNDDGIGSGMYIDNFHIWKKSLVDVPESPTNLVAKSINNSIYLNWDEIKSNDINGEIIYDDGSFEDGIFLQSGSMNVGTVFDIPFGASAKLNEISIFSVDTVSNISLFGYNVIAGEPETAPIYEINSSNIIYDSWNKINVDWSFNGDFMIAHQIDSLKYVSLDLSSTPSKNSWIERNGLWQRWQNISLMDNLSDGEWGIRAKIETSNTQFPYYNIYKESNQQVFDLPMINGKYLTENSFIDSAVESNTEYSYAVSSVYNIGTFDEIESALSESVSIRYQKNSVEEIKYDSGVSSTGVTSLGENSWYAVRFTPSEFPVKILNLQFFSTQKGGNIYFGIFENDSLLNIPSKQLGNIFILTNVNEGWNTKDISGANISINKGDFYIALGEISSFSPLGIDLTTNNEFSNRNYYFTQIDGWKNISSLGYDGNLLIRAVVEKTNELSSENDIHFFPKEFKLKQNYPNPFNSSTKIEFEIPEDLNVEIRIFDITGNEIISKNFGFITSGNYVYTLDGKNIPSGLYFYQMKTNNYNNTKKFMLLK